MQVQKMPEITKLKKWTDEWNKIDIDKLTHALTIA